MFDTLIVRWLKRRRSLAVLLSSGALFLQIQFVPDKQQALYWYNGSSYYTLFYAFSLLLAALAVRIALDGGRVRPLRLILSLLLAVWIGGGNYSTALLSVELLALGTFLLVLRHNRAWRQMLALTLATLGALAVSAAAPGNAVRAATLEGLSPLMAICKSIVAMMRYTGRWTRLPQVAYLAFAAPLLYFMSKSCTWQFRWPFAVCVLAFLLCASQFTPPYYAMGNPGAGRQIDIYFYTHLLMLLFCEFYLCGWFARSGIISRVAALRACKAHFVPACALLAALFAMGCYGLMREMSTLQVAAGLLQGDPQRYDAEYEAWRDELIAAEGDLVIRNLTAPSYFHGPMITKKPSNSRNLYTAAYYGLYSIVTPPGEESGSW